MLKIDMRDYAGVMFNVPHGRISATGDTNDTIWHSDERGESSYFDDTDTMFRSLVAHTIFFNRSARPHNHFAERALVAWCWANQIEHEVCLRTVDDEE